MKAKRKHLTVKQRETLDLLARGYTSKEIAARAGVSQSAINQRIECMLRTYGLSDRRALMRWHLDACDQITTESLQVSDMDDATAPSVSDRMPSTSGASDCLTDDQEPPSRVFVLPILETGLHQGRASIQLRSACEAIFIGAMTLLSVAMVLKQLLA